MQFANCCGKLGSVNRVIFREFLDFRYHGLRIFVFFELFPVEYGKIFTERVTGLLEDFSRILAASIRFSRSCESGGAGAYDSSTVAILSMRITTSTLVLF